MCVLNNNPATLHPRSDLSHQEEEEEEEEE